MRAVPCSDGSWCGCITPGHFAEVDCAVCGWSFELRRMPDGTFLCSMCQRALNRTG